MGARRTAARAAADKKAFQIVALEVAELTSYTNSLLICSGASDRQVLAIADEVQAQLKELRKEKYKVRAQNLGERRRAGHLLTDRARCTGCRVPRPRRRPTDHGRSAVDAAQASLY